MPPRIPQRLPIRAGASRVTASARRSPSARAVLSRRSTTRRSQMRTVRDSRVCGGLAAGLVTFTLASQVFAQGYPDDGREQIALSVGGGVQGFTDSDLDDTVGTGGSWDVRARFGTRSALSFEAAYIGSAQ